MGRWHSWSLVGMAIATVHIAQPFSAQGVSVTEVARIAKNITVLIEGTNSHGSGILLQRKGSTYVILTAYHVVEKAGQYTVKTVDGQRYAMQPNSIRRLPGVDLATLEIESNRDYTLATLGNAVEAVEGMPVFVAGFPAQEASVLGAFTNLPRGG